MPYNTFLTAGASPAQARILAAIEMAESGGNPNARNYRAPGTWGPQDPGENSWGPMQINLFAHPDVTPQQAMDPAFAARWALAQGSYTPWSTYNSGAYKQYLGANAMPITPENYVPEMDQYIMPPPDSTGRKPLSTSGFYNMDGDPLSETQIREGMIAFDEYGIPVRITEYDPPDSNGPAMVSTRALTSAEMRALGLDEPSSRASRPLSPVSTGIEGLLYDPNTGTPLDFSAYMPRPSYIKGTTDLGNGILGLVDDQGNVVSTAVAPVNDFDRQKLAEDVRRFNDESARGWQGLDWQNRHFDQNFGLQEADTTGFYNDKPTFAREQWDFNRGLQEGELTGQYGGVPTERRYEFDVTEQRLLQQFEGELAERIDARKQRLQEIAIEQQGATSRQAAALAAESANIRAKIDADLAIAGMDNATKIDIAKMQARLEGRGQDVQQRGQDIQAGVAYRGQDIDLQGQALQAQQARAQYGIEALRDDPFAQATFLLGGDPTAAMTPAQYAIKSMQVPQVRPVGAAPALPGQIKPVALRGGGSVVESDEPVLAIVGEEDPSSAEAALLAPGSAVEPLRLSRNASPAQMERAALNAVPRLQRRLTRMAGGGAIQPWSAVSASYAKKASTPGLIVDPAQYQSPVTASAYKSGAGGMYNTLYRKKPVAAPAPTIQPVGPVTVQPPAPAFTPDDSLLPGPTTSADLIAARKTVADALTKSLYGGGMPEFGGLPKVNPVFGVNLTQPEQLAPDFWRNPRAARSLITSAWGMRNMPEDEFYRRLQAATPPGVRPFVPQYARRGIAIVPVGRAA